MKILNAIHIIACLSIGGVAAQGDDLSDVDRDLLLERLKEFQKKSDESIAGKVGVALAAFRKARTSDAETHDLYLNCIEKLKFEDQAKKGSEFRDWKKNHRERKDTPGFRLALRHQLNWLVLGLESTLPNASPAQLGTSAIAVLDRIIEDSEKLKDQRSILGEAANKSVFAEAYGVDHLDFSALPSSPLDLDSIYEKLVFPAFREPAQPASLSRAWQKRIEHARLMTEKWSTTESNGRNPALEKWTAETRPVLIWKMEVDLFRHGDQKAASLRMLDHLQKNLTHPSAPDWIGQFNLLVVGGSAPSLPKQSE